MSTEVIKKMNREYQRLRRKDHPKRALRSNWRLEHFVSRAQYDVLLEKQHGCCAVCKNVEVVKTGETIRRLAIDHCHTSGKIRGLVCNRCNYVLGLVKDNVDVLRGLANYIETADTGLEVPTAHNLLAEIAGLDDA